MSPKERQDALQKKWAEYTQAMQDARSAACTVNLRIAEYNAMLQAEITRRNCAPGRTVDVFGDFKTVADKDVKAPPEQLNDE